MMARILSQTLIRESQTLIREPSSSHILSGKRSPLLAPSSRLLNSRGRSNWSEKAQLVEVDLEADSTGGEFEVLGMRRLEDAIHGIIVRRSAPDWLPFIPGSSYWVPPRKTPYGVVELVGKLANPMSEEETMSFTTVRGWPSSTYFIEGASPHRVKKFLSKKAIVQSDDDEA